jgi:hypothetical protein
VTPFKLLGKVNQSTLPSTPTCQTKIPDLSILSLDCGFSLLPKLAIETEWNELPSAPSVEGIAMLGPMNKPYKLCGTSRKTNKTPLREAPDSRLGIESLNLLLANFKDSMKTPPVPFRSFSRANQRRKAPFESRPSSVLRYNSELSPTSKRSTLVKLEKTNLDLAGSSFAIDNLKKPIKTRPLRGRKKRFVVQLPSIRNHW